MEFRNIMDDLEVYGLSQWFSSKGLCTVMSDHDGTYEFLLSKGPQIKDGGIRVRATQLTGIELAALHDLFG